MKTKEELIIKFKECETKKKELHSKINMLQNELEIFTEKEIKVWQKMFKIKEQLKELS